MVRWRLDRFKIEIKVFRFPLDIFHFCVNSSIRTDATIYVGGLDDKVGEALLWELFLQAGPVGKSVQHLVAQMLSD